MWTSIKVVLQLRLIQLYGEKDGYLIYKLVILKALENLCCKSNSMASSDLKSQIIKKIAKRSFKLEKVSVLNNEHGLLRKKLLESCLASVEQIKLSILNEFDIFANKATDKNAALDFAKISIEHIKHEMKSFTTKLIRLKEQASSFRLNQSSSKSEIPHCIARNRANCQFPMLAFLERHDTSLMSYYDIESWVKYSIDLRSPSASDQYSEQNLLSLMEKYIQKALNFYAKDPLGYSRMVATCIKIGKFLLKYSNKRLFFVI